MATQHPALPAVELRVHGVSGSPAEETLDRHIIGRVAGDGDAGFYRPRGEYGQASTIGPGGARLEAYRWGSLTAGTASRAFWLLLLPFTLANVAVWLRPPSTGLGRALVRWLCRIFALSITATFTLASIGIAVDLLGWQCTRPGTSCAANRRLFTFAFAGFFAPTGRRMALAAVVPIFVVSLLWYLARRTWAAYEAYHPPAYTTDGDGLAAPTFWDGRSQVGRLRLLHIAHAFAIIDAVLLFVLLRHDLGSGAYAGVSLWRLDPDTVVLAGEVLAGAAALNLVVPFLLLAARGMVDRDAQAGWARLVALSLRTLSLVVTVLTLGYALLPRAPWPAAGPLPGYSATVTVLFAAQAGLLGLLLLVVLTQRHRCKGAMFGGFGAPIVASLALGLAGAFAAGVSYRVADFLDGNAVPSPANFGSQPLKLGLQPPVSYEWAAFGFLFAAVVVLLAAVWVRFVTLPRLQHKAVPDTDNDFDGGRTADPARAAQIDNKIADARVTDHIGGIVGTVWLILAAAGVGATALGVAGIGPVELVPSGSRAATVLHVLVNIGTYLVSISAFGLILLGIQTYRNERVRRTVGVIWDLATFWPRAAHPLAPPCYAERVVPELVRRASWLATEDGGVVLSGHSQGSVLVAATVLQMSPQARARTALLTYGSPLRRLYARAFPAYLNDGVLAAVGHGLTGPDGDPRWRNLWRHTDPIGGQTGIGDIRFTDPAGFGVPAGDTVAPQICAHSGYQVAHGFDDAVAGLTARLDGAGAPAAVEAVEGPTAVLR